VRELFYTREREQGGWESNKEGKRKGDRNTEKIKEQKKEIMLSIISEWSCINSNITGRKFYSTIMEISGILVTSITEP
jgi:hypothetical protein